MNRQPQELAGSLARMRFDYVDLIYSEVPPDGVGLEDAIDMITGLIRAGVARAWGTLNWTPEQMERAWEIADREGVPGPVATQPPYSLVAGRSSRIRPCGAWRRRVTSRSWRRTRWRAGS